MPAPSVSRILRGLRPAKVLIYIGDSMATSHSNNVSTLDTTAVNYSTLVDAGVREWDVQTQQLIVKPATGWQPGPLDPSFLTPFGWSSEYARKDRIRAPDVPLFVNGWSKNGSGFYGGVTAGDDWTPGRSGGLYTSFLTEWSKFVIRLASIGYYPSDITAYVSLGWNDSFNTTDAGNFTAAFAGFVARLRADVIGPTGMLLVPRIQLDKVGVYLQAATIRTAQAAYVAADPYSRLLNMDGLQNMNPVPAGDQHWKGEAQPAIGRMGLWQRQGLWFPQVWGGTFPAAEWLPLDTQNTISAAALSTLYDETGAGISLTGSGGQAPTLTTSGGFTFARYNGSSNVLKYGAQLLMGMGGGYTIALTISASSPAAGQVFVGEAANVPTPFITYNSDGSGGLRVQVRNDAGSIGPNNAALLSGCFDGAKHTVILTDDRSTTITPYKDGVVGTAASYTAGTTSTNTFGIAGWGRNSTDSGFMALDLYHAVVVPGVMNAAWIANYQAFARREFGAP